MTPLEKKMWNMRTFSEKLADMRNQLGRHLILRALAYGWRR